MAEFEIFWKYLIPKKEGENVQENPETTVEREILRAYASAATYGRFASCCKRQTSTAIFRTLANGMRDIARNLTTEYFLQCGMQIRPTGPLYERPTTEALRKMYYFEQETVRLCQGNPQLCKMAQEATEQIRGILSKSMP